MSDYRKLTPEEEEFDRALARVPNENEINKLSENKTTRILVDDKKTTKIFPTIKDFKGLDAKVGEIVNVTGLKENSRVAVYEGNLTFLVSEGILGKGEIKSYSFSQKDVKFSGFFIKLDTTCVIIERYTPGSELYEDKTQSIRRAIALRQNEME